MIKSLLFTLILFSVIRLEAQPSITSHDLPPGYSNVELRFRNQLVIDNAGHKWVAFAHIGLGKYDGNTWVVYDSLNSGLPCDSITCLVFDNSGNIWTGTRLGLVFFDGNSWQVYNTQNSGLPADIINTLAWDGTLLWIGTSEGIASYDGSTWNTYNTSNSGIVNDTIRKIVFDSNGTAWIGTQSGLSGFDGSNWVNFDTSNSIMQNDEIYDLCEDNTGRIWISARSYDVYFLEGGTLLRNFTEDYYTDMIQMRPAWRASIAQNINGKMYFLIQELQSLVEIDGPNYKFYYFSPGTFLSPNSFSHDLGIDSQDVLWLLPHLTANPTGALKEISLSNYQVPSWLSPTHHNSKTLKINDVRALILNRGDMHWDPSSNNPAYEVPAGSGKHANYASTLWVGGLDAGGNLHVAAQSYRQSGTDYWPGPISGISVPFDSSSCLAFDKMYNVYKWEIEEFKTNFLNGSVGNGTYAVPTSILEWPAKGNGVVTDEKAPFVDFDSSGSYDPYNGDYPLIKGDQMLFWIFNDSLAPHSNTEPSSVGIEVHGSAYAYSCPGIADSNAVINRTTLYHYRIINRSTNNYNNLFTGLWTSSVIGNFTDNYMGCDSIMHIAFAYNGDNDDEISQGGYGLNPPMQNLVVLKGMLADPGDGMDNNLDGIIDETGERTTMNHLIHCDGPNNSPVGNPNGDLDHYQYMQSIWLDGLHLTYGGDGRDQGAAATNFMFSGTPYDTGWTEFNAGNFPYERVFVAGSGPVSLAAGGELSIDFAYVFTWDPINPNGLNTSIARNIADVQRVQSWFDNDNFPSCLIYSVGADEISSENIRLDIYPNPASDRLFISAGTLFNNDKIQITDVSGRTVMSQGYSDTNGINISLLKDGVYSLRIIKKQSIFTGKFVKLR